MNALNISPRYVLPLIMLVSVMTLTLRLGDIWHTLSHGGLFTAVSTVHAATEPKETKKEEPAPIPTEKDKAQETKESTPAPPSATTKESLKPSSPPPADKKSTAESDLYKLLAGRREQLDKRAQELDAREALVGVAEQRVDQKIKEMGVLRKQLETLLGQAGTAQQEQLENLVKVYEIMKPKEAAKIFEALEMPILLGVIQKMKPARTAAILAEMDAEKAKEITTALSKRDQLPQIK